ncbi:glycosyltransferase BC10-like [Nymphaea colorata]|nr:glycosyltransferase BC10-like [Nymphaea colorata]
MEKKKPDDHQHVQAGIHPFRSQFYPTNLIPNCLLFALGITFCFIASFHISRHLSIFNPSGFSFFLLPLQSAANASAGLNPTREKAGTETEGDTEHHTVNHGMEDDELFWRAAMVSKIHSRQSHRRVPKVAFLFLTRGSLPLAPLWERFFKGHDDKYSIYVHTDPSYKVAVPMQSIFYGRRIPSREVKWGHISLVQAERRLLANALLDPSNQRFMILSESCIPLFPFTTIYDYLINSTQSFVDVYDDPRPFGRGRYDSRMAPLIRLGQWRKGLAWFEVDRRIAVEIVSDNTYFPLFDKFPVPVPDEHYFPTLMNIRFGPWGANRSLTYVDWSKGGPHPAGFGRLDITYDLLWKMRHGNRCVYNGHETSLCTLFARKFFPDSLDTLLDMASQALGF